MRNLVTRPYLSPLIVAAVGGAFTALALLLVLVLSGGADADADGPGLPPAISALKTGAPATIAGPIADALSSASVSAYGPDLAAARSVPAPGRPTSSWTLIPAANGGACLAISDGTLTCGSAESIDSGRFGLIIITGARVAPTPAQVAAMRRANPPRLATGTRGTGIALPRGVVSPGVATRNGVVADGVSAVRAVDSGGEVLGTATVHHNVYSLALGNEGEAKAIQLLATDGTVEATFQL